MSHLRHNSQKCSAPAEHFSSARSLAGNCLCGVWYHYGAQQGSYTTTGITALCEGLKASAGTSLECAAAPKYTLTARSVKPR